MQKNCQNLIIGFQVMVENVGYVFLGHSVCDNQTDRQTGNTTLLYFNYNSNSTIVS